MFEKVSEIAEGLAIHVSRRQFLGRAGSSALAAAAALGGILVLSHHARAGNGHHDQGCSANSSYLCSNSQIGDPCGQHGHCTVVKGTLNDCLQGWPAGLQNQWAV